MPSTAHAIELMSGTLSALLHQRLPIERTLGILLDVAKGLEYLHGLSVVHRGECRSQIRI